jgi:Uma2 family endonuclease
MVDAGVFTADERLELLDGVLVAMSPRGTAHVFALARLLEAFQPGPRRPYEVRCQMPLTLATSEPEPDLAIVVRRRAARAPRHPETALLIVEVAAETLAKDLQLKAELYARAGVFEYWVVDLEHEIAPPGAQAISNVVSGSARKCLRT